MYTSSCSTKPKSTAEEYLTCKESPECSEKEVFTLVGKCLLKGKSQVSFWNRGFRSRIPFEKMEPPVLEASVVEQDLWSKGPASLAGVMSLRICLSFVVGNCPLGIKKLSVWGQPSRSCSSDIIEKLLKAHSGNKKAVSDLTIVSENPEPQQPVLLNEDLGIPEEFLDPITQELMTLPILLPSGKAVDQSTLEEYNKREAAWGRSPNDPFTAVPFSKDSRPLPHPCLKSRIDLFLLQKGDQCLTVPFVVGRTSCSQLPQPSRLTSEKTSLVSGKRKGEYVSVSPLSDDAVQNKIASHLKPAFECTSFGNAESTSSEKSLAAIQEVKNSSLVQKCSKELNGQRQEECAFSSATMIPAKKLRAEEHNTLSSPADSGSSTHMQRLSDSLDTALASALRTFPSFTAHLKKSNVDQTRFESTGRCSLNLSEQASSLFNLAEAVLFIVLSSVHGVMVFFIRSPRSESPSSRYGLSERALEQLGESTDSSGPRSATSSLAESEKGSECKIGSADLDSSLIGEHLKLEGALQTAISITPREPGIAGALAAVESDASPTVQEGTIKMSKLEVMLAEIVQDIKKTEKANEKARAKAYERLKHELLELKQEWQQANETQRQELQQASEASG
ncbi:RNF37 protein, partial [Polypterus senegalus]